MSQDELTSEYQKPSRKHSTVPSRYCTQYRLLKTMARYYNSSTFSKTKKRRKVRRSPKESREKKAF